LEHLKIGFGTVQSEAGTAKNRHVSKISGVMSIQK
jgi:hypothetical protein